MEELRSIINDYVKENVVGDDSNIISLSEWKRIRERVNRMTLQELAMTVHQLINVVIDLTSHVEELQDKVDQEYHQ